MCFTLIVDFDQINSNNFEAILFSCDFVVNYF